jgi:tetratricopeptide (TPR) repeat protein
MRVIRYFDPGREGFLGRLARLALALALLGAWLAAGGLAAALRTERGRFALVAGLSEAGLHGVSLPLAHGLRVDYPTSNWHYYRLEARDLRRLGRVAESLAVYDAAVAALPDEWWAHSHRCFYNALMGDAARVLDSCDRQLELGPTWPDVAYDRRAIARAVVGDRAGAIADFERAVDWMRRSAPQDWRLPTRQAWLDQLRAGRDPLTEAAIREELSHY